MATKKKSVKKKSAKKVDPTKTVKKKAVKKKAVKKKAPAKKAVKKAVKKAPGKIQVTSAQRHKMICEAAYYISLKKTSETVNPTEDWLQAESAIDQICELQD